MRRDAALIDLVASVVDGGTPDWAALVRTARSPEERLALEQLRIVAGVAAVHGSMPPGTDETGPVAAAGTALTAVASPPRAAANARETWGHFALYECIGEGSYGRVYRAWDTRLQRQVAIKLLKVGPRRTEATGPNGLLLEAQTLASVVHENVVAIHSVEQHDGRIGLCMEFIEGQTLEQHLKRAGWFGAREAAGAGLELCRALAAVHAAGVIHCDIKARNVMRSNAGRLVLMDFGAGVFSDDHSRLRRAGTPMYLAPEVLDGGTPTVRSDLYSLGVLLFFAVTGHHPVEAGTVEELSDAHRSQRRTHLSDHRPDLPERFMRAVERALDPDPARRFQTAGAMRSALADALEDLSASTTRHATPSAPERRPQTLLHPAMVPARRWWWLPAAAVVAVALAIGALWWMQRWRAAPASPETHRIAVIPLRNLTGGPDWQVDAATEDLMGAIARVPGVLVTDWRSAARFAQRMEPATPQIARDLKVGWVVEGSLRRASIGGDLRLSISLFDSAGTQRWSQTYVSPDPTLAGIPSQVAMVVAKQLGREAQRTPLPAPVPLEARAAYSQARFLMRNVGSANDLQALAHLERAVAIDPTYARAHAALAECVVRLESVGTLSRADARQRAGAALDRALALDETLAEAHAWTGNVRLMYEWDWGQAEAAYRRALDLNPSLVDARIRYAYLLAALGRTAEGLAEARLAQDVDPLFPHLGDVAMLLLYDRQYEPAIRLFRERIDQEPNQAARRYSLARALAAVGRDDEALVEMRRAIAAAGGTGSAPVYDAELARLLARRGAPEGRRLLEEVERLASGDTPNLLAYIGYIHVALGNVTEAFEYLDRAADGRAGSLIWAAVDERLDPVRRDPRYARLEARLDIPR